MSLTGFEYIADGGDGTFVQSGGTNQISLSTTTPGGLEVGANASDIGTYSLSAGNINFTGANETMGYLGHGSFVQTGGTNSMTGSGLNLGVNSGSSGYYSLSGSGILSDTSNANATAVEVIGWGGSGTFVQTGGTNTISNGGILQVAYGYGSGGGSYSLSGGLLSSVYEYVGNGGNGTMTQSGGTNTATQVLDLGIGSSGSYTGSGTYALSAGTLNSLEINIGTYNGIGTVSQSGGTASASILSVGGGWDSKTSGNGAYSLSNTGTFVLANAYGNIEIVGDYGPGTFVQSGGLNTMAYVGLANLGLAVGVGGSGSYSLSNTGNSRPPPTRSKQSDIRAAGTFTQSGGSNQTFDLYVGDFTGGLGIYALSAGTLATVPDSGGPGGENIGSDASGSFLQTGGTNDMSDGSSLYLGVNAGISGYYSLSSTSSCASTLSVGGSEYVGDAGNGMFIQSGGTHTVERLDLPRSQHRRQRQLLPERNRLAPHGQRRRKHRRFRFRHFSRRHRGFQPVGRNQRPGGNAVPWIVHERPRHL